MVPYTLAMSPTFLGPLSQYVDTPRSLWRMGSATPDLRLPSQSQSTATAPWPVHISSPAEGRKLRWPNMIWHWLQNGVHINTVYFRLHILCYLIFLA